MDQFAVAESLQTIAAQAVALARKQGADQAEVGASYEEGLSVSVRMGELESVERQRDRGLAITVYRDQRKGSSSTTDFSATSVEETVRKALSIGSFTTVLLGRSLRCSIGGSLVGTAKLRHRTCRDVRVR